MVTRTNAEFKIQGPAGSLLRKSVLMLKEAADTGTCSETLASPEVPPNRVWYQTLQNVGSFPEEFLIQMLAMPVL